MNSVGFDRDLSMAGRAIVKDRDGKFVQKLVKIERPSIVIKSDNKQTLTFK